MESEYSLQPPAMMANPNGPQGQPPATPTLRQVMAAVQQENDRMRAELQQVAAAQHQQQQLAAQLEANQQHLRQQQQHMSAAATPVTAVTKLPGLTRTLFHGRSDDKTNDWITANDWINSFKSYVKFYSLNDWPTIHKELLVHMKGSAFAWIEDRVFDSLDDFFQQFRHEYGERLVQDRLVKQLHAMVPTTNLAEYVRSFRATYKLLDVAHRDLVWIRFAFINGVPDHMLAAVSSSVLNATSVDAMFDCCADVGHIKSVGSMDVDAIENNGLVSALNKMMRNNKPPPRAPAGAGGVRPERSDAECGLYRAGKCTYGNRCKFTHPFKQGYCRLCGGQGHMPQACPTHKPSSSSGGGGAPPGKGGSK